MKKREIETYMDAFMEGFWQCYCVMYDLIEDDEDEPVETEPVKEEPKPEKPKKANAQKIDRGKVCALLDAGWKVPKIAGEMHTSEASIYNIQKEYREQKAKQLQEGQAQA